MCLAHAKPSNKGLLNEQKTSFHRCPSTPPAFTASCETRHLIIYNCHVLNLARTKPWLHWENDFPPAAHILLSVLSVCFWAGQRGRAEVVQGEHVTLLTPQAASRPSILLVTAALDALTATTTHGRSALLDCIGGPKPSSYQQPHFKSNYYSRGKGELGLEFWAKDFFPEGSSIKKYV